MRKTTLTAFLLALVAFLNSASAQLQLVPLSTFGTNNDGTIRPGDFGYTWLTGDGNRYNRGMAFNPVTGHLLIVDRSLGIESINVIDGLTGAYVSHLNLDATSLGGSSGFVYDQVAVGEDGAIYAGNLTTSSSSIQFILYRWASETDVETMVYGPGDPGNGAGSGNSRWGDTMAVHGSGMSTEVLLGTQSGTYAAVLKPTAPDMLTFTSSPLKCSVPSGGIANALAFAAPGTFYAKAASADGKPMYLLGYDTTLGVATNIYTYGLDQFPGRVGVLGVQQSSNWLAAAEYTTSSNPDIVRLYDISTPASPPVLLDRQVVTVWTNSNAIFAGGVAFGFGTNVYALDSDNGLVAFTITNAGSPSLAPYLFGPPVSHIAKVGSNTTFTVGVDGTSPLAYQWLKNASPILEGTNAVLLLTNCQSTAAGQYSVVVTNVYGALTSSVASLTIIPNFGNTLDFDPFNYTPGTGLVGQGGWVLRSTAENGSIEAGNLNVPGLAPSTGNRYTMTNSTNVRWVFDPPQTNSAIWFSFALRIDSLSGGTTSETTAGLSSGTGTSFPCKINLVGNGVAGAGGTYQIGMYKSSGTTSGALAPNVFTTSDTVFVVGRYTFRPDTTTDDSGDLWLNPPPSTFGESVPPTPVLADVGVGRTDLTYADGFFWRFVSAGYPKRVVDEFRLGYSWAEVTTPGQPVLSAALTGVNSAVLMWSTNTPPSFGLQSLGGVDDVDGWQPVSTPVVVQGNNYTVTVTAAGTKLFRLKK
jgi:hypothetical protein